VKGVAGAVPMIPCLGGRRAFLDRAEGCEARPEAEAVGIPWRCDVPRIPDNLSISWMISLASMIYPLDRPRELNGSADTINRMVVECCR